MKARASSTRHVDLLGQAERREAVHDAEVGRLGALALGLGDLLDRDAGDRGGRDAVHVFAAPVGVDQGRLVGEEGHEAQLDLRVVGDHQAHAFGGDEAVADLAAELGADGDVLQVRVGARQAPRRGDGLVERGVQPPAARVDARRQRLEVGVDELGELAPLLDERHDGVLVAQRLAARGRRSSSRSCPCAPAAGRGVVNSTSASCCGEPMVKSAPASSTMPSRTSSMRSRRRAVISPSRCTSMATPTASMAASTRTRGSSTVAVQRARRRARRGAGAARRRGAR